MIHEQLQLQNLMEEVEKRMRHMKYGEGTIQNYWSRWKDLLRYAEEKGVEFFTVEFGEKYLLEKCSIDVCTYNAERDMPKWKVRAFKRPIYVLADFQNNGVVTRKRRIKRVEIPGNFREPAEHYIAACRQRYNSEKTIDFRMFTIKSFLLYLEQIKVDEIGAINGTHISEFTKTMIGWSQRSIGDSLGTLRHFFRFLYQERYHSRDLSVSMPHVNCGRTAKLPQIWAPDEVERVLRAVDRGTPEGKRDYAILLLVTHLGLREGDVQNLKFESICWAECLIRLNQMKTGHPLELPLNEDIGSAIIDYLKYGRPIQDTSQYVFVRHKAPYGKCVNYYHVMQKYLMAAKIRLDTTKPHGLHTLRHTLATRLLEQRVPLQTISQILGHTSVNSTNIYLRVDLNSLRECALNPEEVFVND